MAYILTNGSDTIVAYPYNIGLLRRDNPNVSFPSNPSTESLVEWNVFELQATPAPSYDPYNQRVEEGTPTTSDGGATWQQTWNVIDFTPEEAESTLADFQERSQAEAEAILSGADQYVVTALVRGQSLTPEFEAYRAAVADPTSLPGYPAATEWPTLPEVIFTEETAALPIDAYTKAETDTKVDDALAAHLAEFHTTPSEDYKGYTGALNRLWGDDPSVNQILFAKTPSTSFSYRVDSGDTDEDDFMMSGLADASMVVALNIYGSDNQAALDVEMLKTFFRTFIDNVLYDGETEVTDLEVVKQRFYDNFSVLEATLPSGSLYDNFDFLYTDDQPLAEFWNLGPDVWSSVNGNITLTGVSIRVDSYGNYGFGGWSQSGQSDDGANVVIPGTSLGGVTPDNDATVTWSNAAGDYVVTGTSAYTGNGPQIAWPDNYINDGGDDQYDSGNYIYTNYYQEVPYGGGNVNDGSNYFGSGSEYVSLYNNSIWAMIVKNPSGLDWFSYHGGTGSDGDGTKAYVTLFESTTPPPPPAPTFFEFTDYNGQNNENVITTYVSGTRDGTSYSDYYINFDFTVSYIYDNGHFYISMPVGSAYPYSVIPGVTTLTLNGETRTVTKLEGAGSSGSDASVNVYVDAPFTTLNLNDVISGAKVRMPGNYDAWVDPTVDFPSEVIAATNEGNLLGYQLNFIAYTGGTYTSGSVHVSADGNRAVETVAVPYDYNQFTFGVYGRFDSTYGWESYSNNKALYFRPKAEDNGASQGSHSSNFWVRWWGTCSYKQYL